jgi:hypothetical protein
MSDFILHNINGLSIGLRQLDGYVNATRLTQAYKEQTGKRRDVANWLENKRTQEMLKHLSSVTVIPVTELYQVVQGGVPENQGTWIHPKLATRFAIWLSDDFGLMVENWVEEWMTQKVKPQAELTPAEAILQMAQFMVEQERKTKELEAKLALESQRNDQIEELVKQHDAELERIHKPCGDYFTVMGYARLKGVTGISLKMANSLGRKASAKCRELGLEIEQVRDPRFGSIGSYPEMVLEELI